MTTARGEEGETRYYPLSPGVTSVLFTDVVARCGGRSAGRGGEDPKIAAAVKAGLSLLMPNGGGGIGISGGGEGAARRHGGREGEGDVEGRGEGRQKERHGVLREGRSRWQRPHCRGGVVVCVVLG